MKTRRSDRYHFGDSTWYPPVIGDLKAAKSSTNVLAVCALVASDLCWERLLANEQQVRNGVGEPVDPDLCHGR